MKKHKRFHYCPQCGFVKVDRNYDYRDGYDVCARCKSKENDFYSDILVAEEDLALTDFSYRRQNLYEEYFNEEWFKKEINRIFFDTIKQDFIEGSYLGYDELSAEHLKLKEIAFVAGQFKKLYRYNYRQRFDYVIFSYPEDKSLESFLETTHPRHLCSYLVAVADYSIAFSASLYRISGTNLVVLHVAID